MNQEILSIMDNAVTATLKKHPEKIYQTSVAIALERKARKEPKENYAPGITKENHARTNLIHADSDIILQELLKNAIKVAILLERKSYQKNKQETSLMAGTYIVGEAGCMLLKQELKQGKTIEKIVKEQPMLLSAISQTFVYARHVPNNYIQKIELDAIDNLKYCQEYFQKIEAYHQ